MILKDTKAATVTKSEWRDDDDDDISRFDSKTNPVADKSMEKENGSGSSGGNTKGSNSEAIVQIEQREHSSRFNGVIRVVGSCKWGARICLRYKQYWLGTYEKEEDAAVAFDRAAIKLLRNEARLNLPPTNYTAQEYAFQSKYSAEEILGMLKDQTYSSKFTSFLAGESSTTISNAPWRQISHQMLFEMELTHNDVHPLKGLHVPKEHEEYFPALGLKGSAEITFYDKDHCPWTFWYGYWNCTKCYLFTSGWRNFAKTRNAKRGDIVRFYRSEFEQEGQRKVANTIDLEHINAERGNEGENAEPGNTSGEKSTGVMLFGVRLN